MVPMRALPADLPRFAPASAPLGVARSNLDLAEDFMDLMFALEGGQQVPVLLKYRGPVRVALRSPGLSGYASEIGGLIARLRHEAGIDIALTKDPNRADIHIEAVPSAQIARIFPGAACFILPGVTSWREFRSLSLMRRPVQWARQTELGTTAIFIPSDSTPQDTRDCLHEELAQALGPANDLYRLPQSVFNDDNVHSLLTPFDMLMLRVLYAPELRAGMPPGEVAEALPQLFARLNPRGRGRSAAARAPESRGWKMRYEAALDGAMSRSDRLASAREALREAQAMRPPDHRLGLARVALGRLLARDDPAQAGQLFEAALTQFQRGPDPDGLYTAQAAFHRALFALTRDDPATALRLARRYMRSAERGQNAMLLSGFHAVASKAFLAQGALGAARSERSLSLHWARYAFGGTDAMKRAHRVTDVLPPASRAGAAQPVLPFVEPLR